MKTFSVLCRLFEANLPHTAARLESWLCALPDVKSELLDPCALVIALLPFNLFVFALQLDISIEYFRGILRPLMVQTFWIYKALNFLLALNVILDTPGIGSKALMAFDLLLETMLVLLVKLNLLVVCVFPARMVEDQMRSFNPRTTITRYLLDWIEAWMHGFNFFLWAIKNRVEAVQLVAEWFWDTLEQEDDLSDPIRLMVVEQR